MTNVAGKDDNGFPVIFGVSHLDGVTPIQVKFDLAIRDMLVDSVTTIAFDPSINTNQNSTMYPFAKATASIDSSYTTADATTRPWVVHATTGAVLIEPL